MKSDLGYLSRGRVSAVDLVPRGGEPDQRVGVTEH